jgi:hypothetical protein
MLYDWQEERTSKNHREALNEKIVFGHLPVDGVQCGSVDTDEDIVWVRDGGLGSIMDDLEVVEAARSTEGESKHCVL